MSKKSHRNAASSTDTVSEAPHKTIASDQSRRTEALVAYIPDYREESFPHLQLDRDAALRILALVDLDFQKTIGPDRIQSFIERLKFLHVAAYTEHSRNPRHLRSKGNLEKLEKDLVRAHDTLVTIDETLSPLFDAISTLFVAPFAGGPLGTFYDGGDSPREFNSTIFEMINASHYLQLLIIKIKWISEVFEGMTPDEQEDFFFRGRSDRERRAFQTIFSFVKKGGGVGPTAFIARQIATVYKLTFESPVSYSRLKHLDTLEERGNKLTSTERQFHDGNSLRFACVLIRELRLDDFMERDLLTDRDAPFPWLETAKGIQNNPWEQVKNKIGTIWENDKKRPNKSQIFSWMTPETSK